MKKGLNVGFVIGCIIGILVLSVVLGSFYVVQDGNRGIVFRFGKITDVVDGGLHFKIPFSDSVKIVDVRTQAASADSQAGTKNMQSATTRVSVNYHLVPSQLQDTYTKFGIDDLDKRIIDPRIQDIVKAVVARYDAEELLLKRDEVSKNISTELAKSLGSYNLAVEGVQVTNFSFSSDFTKAIEAKQTSEQYAKKAVNDLERVKVEADQAIAQAKGQAEAIRIQAEAIRQQGGEEYVRLKAIEKWSGELPTYYGGGQMLFNVPTK